jgi:NAD(P)H-dependent FMN reductase
MTPALVTWLSTSRSDRSTPSSWKNREGRFGGVVARWFVAQAQSRDDMDIDVIDLAEVDLPAVLPARRSPAVTAYAKRIERADAFVVVTPEYNHGYPAALKQAIDLVYDEWQAKPVGFVSYGGISGGLRAVEQLRQVFVELHAMTVRDTVSFAMAHGLFDASGEPVEPDRFNTAATAMLDGLRWWGKALRVARRTDGIGAAATAEAADGAVAAAV